MTLKRNETERDRKAVNKLRESIGLAPIKKGVRCCLKCEKEFLSFDLMNMKTCSRCRLGPYTEDKNE
jgi:hypothetical protein